LRLQTEKEYVSREALAVLHVAPGEREQRSHCSNVLNTACDLQLLCLRVDPSFDSLREGQRFKDLMRDVDLTL
jgi:hypothetical protein